MKQSLASITTIDEIMPGSYLIWLESPEIASAARPGQFVMVRCGNELLLRRPLGVHQVDKVEGRIALLFAVVGKGTHWLSQRQIGDAIDIFGPLGNGFSIAAAPQNLLLLAGGSGIAPLWFLAREAAERGHLVTLLMGVSTAAQLYPIQQSLPTPMRIIAITEDGTSGKRGMITDLLPDFVNWADRIFACGPLPMYKAMARMRRLKNKPVQVSLETRMGCGLGVCYGCTIKTKSGLKQVCKDGPVFDLGEVLWNKLA